MSFTQSLQITMLAPLHHVEMIGATQESNAARASSKQMAGSLTGSLIAIGNDLRKTVRKTSSRKEHQRHIQCFHLRIVRIVGCVLRQTRYHAVNMHGQKTLHCPFFPHMALMAVGREDKVTMLQRIFLYAIKHGRIIMSDKIGYNNTNDMGNVLPKALRKWIGMIIAFLGKLLNLPADLFAHLMAVMQCTRNGGYADMKFRSQILQGCSMLFHYGVVVCHNDGS